MSTLSELLPAGSGGKNVDFVADGAVNNAQAVGLETNGKVKPISLQSQSAGTNSGQTYESQSVERQASVFDPTRQVLVVAYENMNQSGYGYGKGMGPNGSTGSSASYTLGNSILMAGSGASAAEKQTEYLSGTFDSTNNFVVFCYRDGINACRVVAGVASSFNTSFYTSYQAISNSPAINFTPEICYDSHNQKIVIVASDLNTNSMQYVVGSIASDGSITFGTVTTGWQPSGVNAYYQNKMTFDSTNNKVCLNYCISPSTGFGYTVAGTVSGNSITWGTPYGYSQGVSTTTNNDFAFDYDPVSDSILGVFRHIGSANYPHYFAVRYNASTNKFEDFIVPTTLISSAVETGGNVGCSYSTLGQKFIIGYRINGSYLYGQSISISGNSATVDSATQIFTPSGSMEMLNIEANDVTGTLGMGSFCFKDNGLGADGRVYAYTPSAAVSNQSSFIGIADAAISDTATGSVTIKGGIVTNASLPTLTPNSVYYVQTDGTINTTSTSPALRLGKALSSTSINLEFNS